ncbi:putative MFS-type transporter SLC18B1 [Apostichopus japonicus]|uniref:Putative MFS-type transporter SLC18B1 n=1 Tax=Stichopus japonicus TaxID=307972 RepID=A0A2G8LD21_STIJA|nr:putative MFS-type transporter SLC18B1 [Apostichopus japonicus]
MLGSEDHHDSSIHFQDETEPLLNGHANGHSKKTETNQDEPQKNDNKPFLTRRQLLTLLSLGITSTLQNASFAILTPFFPVEASKKGTKQWQIGLIFGIYSLISFVISPLCGKILPRVGGKFMFLSGLWISAGCNMLFGALDRLQSGPQFIYFCFLLRCVGAVGSAACGTASFALITNCFPNNIAQMLAWMETFSGLGVMIGPFIGGVFYQIGGYQLPFLVLGGACMVCVPINIFLLPSQRDVSSEMGSMRQLFTIPTVWPICIAIMMVPAGLGFFDATIALHAQQFDVTPVTIGMMFLLTGGIYACLSPLWGYLADKKKYTRLMIEIGFIFIATSYLFIGPSPLLKMKSSLTNIWIGLVILGVGLGSGLVPTFQDVMMSARKYGMPDTMATHSVTSGLFNSMFALGSFIGPTFGSLMVQQIGFEWSVTVFALAAVIVTILVLVMDLCEKNCGRSGKSSKVIFSIVEDDRESFLPASAGIQDKPDQA